MTLEFRSNSRLFYIFMNTTMPALWREDVRINGCCLNVWQIDYWEYFTVGSQAVAALNEDTKTMTVYTTDYWATPCTPATRMLGGSLVSCCEDILLNEPVQFIGINLWQQLSECAQHWSFIVSCKYWLISYFPSSTIICRICNSLV